jgi:hypothetical protein
VWCSVHSVLSSVYDRPPHPPLPSPSFSSFLEEILRVGFVRYLMGNTAKLQAILQLETVREQYTVVFALHVTEPAS